VKTLAFWLMRLSLGLLILATTVAAGLAAVWALLIATAPRGNLRDQGGMAMTFGVAFFAVVHAALVVGWLPWAVLWVCRVGRDTPPADRPGAPAGDRGR